MSHSDRLALLRKWRSKYGLRATYGKLAECFYNADRLEMVEAICKVLQANTSIPQPAAMQPYVAYSTTQTQPPQQQFMQSPQQQLMQPTPSLTGGKTHSVCTVYINTEHSQNSCYCFYISIQSMQLGTPHLSHNTSTLTSPASIQLVPPTSQHILNHHTLATLHNQTNMHPSKVIFHHVIINACAAQQRFI